MMFRTFVFFFYTSFQHPNLLNFFHVVSLMESLDSTLENKRPAAALDLLSQQKKQQAAISSEGQYPTSISVFTFTTYFPVGDMLA